MKGIVFQELIKMVEKNFGDAMLEDIISNTRLPSEGAYTSVGTYDHAEILALVSSLSISTGTEAKDIVKAFGRHLVAVFHEGHREFFDQPNVFSFLKSVDSIIHVEVKKLYPKAELPHFIYEQPSENSLVMHYHSSRPFADLAEGLIEGVIKVFGENIEVLTENSESATSRTFIMRKVS